jgi:hypothetical protein
MKTPFYRSFQDIYAARHEPENLRPIAETYWRILLVCVGVGMIALLVVGVWQFTRVLGIISTSAEQAPVQPNVIDRQKLDQVLSAVDARKLNFEIKKSAPPNAIDPSR